MSEGSFEKYLECMGKHGEYGDGIMLSAAVRLYNRPIVVITPDGQRQRVDMCDMSSAEPIRLGFVNKCHYVSINTVHRNGLSIGHTDDDDVDIMNVEAAELECKLNEQTATPFEQRVSKNFAVKVNEILF